MLLLLVIGEPSRKDLLIFDTVHVDRYVVEIFEFRNVFERYRKLDIREIQHCIMQIRRFSIQKTFSRV